MEEICSRCLEDKKSQTPIHPQQDIKYQQRITTSGIRLRNQRRQYQPHDLGIMEDPERTFPLDNPDQKA
jgi:hypothetical protein